jgi:hypothetical protein
MLFDFHRLRSHNGQEPMKPVFNISVVATRFLAGAAKS